MLGYGEKIQRRLDAHDSTVIGLDGLTTCVAVRVIRGLRGAIKCKCIIGVTRMKVQVPEVNTGLGKHRTRNTQYADSEDDVLRIHIDSPGDRR